ncbi:MAG: bifunctional UDP-N-acetylglucosamine diphosphorylase/glucosamine-1-phosphate N-acetyltransferase GlmU [Acidobacteriota bacterium]
MTGKPTVAVVLAAGKGTRMRSAQPKVLHEAAGRPLLGWALAAARQAGCARIIVVVGHESERVRAAFPDPDLVFVEQREQLGTGHALLQAAPAVAGAATLLVLSGDAPLVRPATLARLLAAAAESFGALAVAELDDPGALGRVVARPDGGLERIVELVDATLVERAVRRVNAGFYALPAPEIFAYLAALRPQNAKGELYLTDALGAAVADGHRLALVELEDAAEAWGINDRRELQRAHRRLVERKLDELMLAGVTILDPATTTVETAVTVGEDSVLHAGVALLGKSVVGRGVALHQGAWLRDCRLGDGVVVEPYSVLDSAEVESGARIGPFARLRPGTRIGAGARVGNFVEVKNSRLGPGAKANHLAYVGDAEVGARANIGAGVVTCNYDGVAKHRTEIGAGAFVGSDTMLVAPVRVGEDATTAAGSVITQDVPDGALGVERTRQKNVAGWAARRKRRRGNQE